MRVRSKESVRAAAMPLLASTLAWTLMASAGPAAAATAALTCEGTKLQRAGEYHACLLKLEGQALKTGRPLDFTKCNTRFTQNWLSAERRGGGECPTSGDETAIRTKVLKDANSIALKLADVRFINNADGTLTDLQTGLTWELKHPFNSPPNPGDPQNPSNTYTWSTTGFAPDGTAFTDFLPRLNNCTLGNLGGTPTGGYAGHCDWRLPTIEELRTIVPPNCGGRDPCIFLDFGPNVYDFYWASTQDSDGHNAWFMNFQDGHEFVESKVSRAFVRAVRGGQ